MAAPVSVWVALSDAGGVYAEAAEALRAEVERVHPGRIEWRVAIRPSSARTGRNRSGWWPSAVPPQRAMQELSRRFEAAAHAGGSGAAPGLRALADPARLRTGQLSAVFLDQPPARQLDAGALGDSLAAQPGDSARR
jgi:hypothetical protein